MMNATQSAHHGYTASAAPIHTNRGVEYKVFARITRNLAAATSSDSNAIAALAGALHENRRLWAVLAADVAEEDNPLPDMLRARILYLAEFTVHHTRKVLRGQADVAPLVEINTAVMRGLRHEEDAE